MMRKALRNEGAFRWLRYLFVIASVLALGLMQSARADSWVNVQKYFPENWQADAQLDLQEYIQKAVDENAQVYFPGSNDAEKPLLYHVTTGLKIPAHHQVKFAPNHRLVRLPSKGHMVTLENHARLSGAIIDGNKYAHWPEFQDLGKSDSGVRLSSYTIVEDTKIYNTPGIGFYSYGNYNKVYRCRVENAGYIDVKFGDMFYQGSRDKWSGDGFYFRGTGNLIKDCEAYDTQRWDFCSSHSGAKQNTYVDCRGGDIKFKSYGFIDLEGADANNRLIRCISPNSNIAIPAAHRTEVIQSMATYISAYDHENPDTVEMYGGKTQGALLDGNITTNGGIVFGGWSSRRNKNVPGGASPIIVNNRMYKMHAGPTGGYSDWSFSVDAVDKHGIIANNMLFEFDDGFTKGPGMELQGVEGVNNQVVYGQWDMDLPKLSLQWGTYDDDLIKERKLSFVEEAMREYVAENFQNKKIGAIDWLPLTGQFIQDPEDKGENNHWSEGIPKDQKITKLPLTESWTFTFDNYYQPGWYYINFKLPKDLKDKTNLYLYAGGIDTMGDLYLNGKKIGHHETWNKPSLHPIKSDELKDGEQLLTVKVWKPPHATGLAGIYAPLALISLT